MRQLYAVVNLNGMECSTNASNVAELAYDLARYICW